MPPIACLESVTECLRPFAVEHGNRGYRDVGVLVGHAGLNLMHLHSGADRTPFLQAFRPHTNIRLPGEKDVTRHGLQSLRTIETNESTSTSLRRFECSQ